MVHRPGIWLIAFGSLMICVLAAILIGPIIQLWRAPLGPGLGFEGTASVPAVLQPETPPDQPVLTDPPPNIAFEPAPSVTPAPTHTPDIYCGQTPSMLVLAIGIDYRPGTYTYGLADVTRLVKVDFVTPRVTVLDFPRDMWVEVPGISDHYGITHSKLNESYFYGTPAMGYYDGPGGGAGLLARTLELNFGARPEHYGVVNMKILIEMIDAIGGVDIYLEEGIDARDNPESEDLWKIYNAGWNHLDGQQAVYYARIRHIDNVFGRADRQTEILCAIKTKLLSPEAVMGIPDMIASFSDNVLTDLSPAQLSQLACLAPRLTPDNIVFARIPEDALRGTSAHNFTWEYDQDQIRQYVAGFLDGSWPPPPVEGESADSHEGQTQQLCPVYPDR